MVSPHLTIEELVSRTKDLPTIPATALQVMRETDSATANAATVGRTLMQDQALTARVLRLANSSYYGLARQVSDLQEAVVILGMRTVRNLALVAGSYPWLSKEIKGYALGPKAMWHHSLGTAVGAQLVGSKSRKLDPQTAFMCGLLHDLGKTVLAVWLENRLGMIMTLAQTKEISFHEAEKAALGYDHCDVGAHLAAKWNLPEVFGRVMLYHHDPNAAPNPDTVVDAVHLGDHLTMHLGLGLGGDGMRYPLVDDTLVRLGLTAEQFEEIFALFPDEFAKHEKMFEALA